MADIGSLETKVKADIREYLQNMTKAEKAAERLEKQVSARYKAMQREAAKLAKENHKYIQSISNFAVGSFKPAVAIAAGALGVFGALALVINSTANSMDKLRDRTLTLKVGAKELQEFDFAARQSGIGVGEMDASILKMQKNISKGAPIFAMLGLDTKKLATMSLTDQISSIGQAYQKLGTDADKTRAQLDIFGKAGAKSSELLTSNIKSLAKEFESLGITLTQSQLDAADAFNDNKAKLDTMFTGFVKIATAEVLPILTDITKAIIGLVQDSGGVRGVAVQFGTEIGKMAKSVAIGIAEITEELKGLKSIYNAIRHPITTMQNRTIRNEFAQNPYGSDDLLTDYAKGRVQAARANPKSEIASIKDQFDPWSRFKRNIENAGDSMQSQVPSIYDKTAQSVLTLGEAAKAAAKTLESNFFSQIEKDMTGNSVGKDYLKSIQFAPTESQIRNKDFDEALKMVYKQAASGNVVTSHVFADLQRQIGTSILSRDFDRGGSVSGMEGALKELKDFVAGKGKDTLAFQVDVTVNKDRLIEDVVVHKSFKDGVTTFTDKRFAEEAQRSGAR
jgi:hypothetical protein